MTALITGASAGIGKELAVEFAKDKVDLILVARREASMLAHAAELQTKYGIQVTVIALDLSAPNRANELYAKVKSLRLQVSTLVNNAGFGDNGEFVDSDLQKQKDMINLNILTLTKLTHLFGADMKARKSGSIMNVASTASFQPGPIMAVYVATKHYVLAFSEAIAEELKPYDVYVSTLCPGPTQSEFGEVAGFGKIVPSDSSPFPKADKVAKFGYAQMKKKRVVFIHGFKNALQANLVRFIPRSVVRKVAYAIMKN
ncbi:SDR family oxidoreductase [Bacteroidia bacterium]|nr:SDR family oxidoreductase [Bacteroidia bacterium]MDB9882648.1 SDR family oxidoreductase [Bacteroidia bacterium]MDC1395499.1 SDR family oxidoreductase [Bacteroidia bacterium]